MINVRVGPEPFDVAAAVTTVSLPGVGAVASFVGIVRGDGGLTALSLEHYPAMTQRVLEDLCRVAADRWSLSGLALHHRVGRLEPGESIVLVACAAPHRADALDACAFLIDRLKTDAPFWKRESFADGREQWVNSRAADDVAAARWS